MVILGIKEIMEQYGVGRVIATRWARECGVKRTKGQTYKVSKEALDKWLKKDTE